MLRRGWKDNEAQRQINEFLEMLLVFGIMKDAEKEGFDQHIPHVMRHIILSYAAIECSWYSIKKRGQYVEAIRAALKRAIKLDPKWNFH